MNRRTFLSTGAAAVSLPFLLTLEGCDNTTIADFVSLIGQDAATLATYFGQTSLATQIRSLSSQIAVDITNWQSGAAATDAIAAINDLIGLVDSIPVLNTSPYAPLVVLVLSALTGLLALLPQSATSSAAAKVVNRRSVTPLPIGGTDKKHISAAKKTFEANWNAALTATPGLK